MNISLCIIFHSIATNWFTKTWPLYVIIDKENTIHSEKVMRPCITLLVSLMTSVWQGIVTKVASISVSDPWSTTRLVPDDPEFGLPIGNLTTPVGREAVLSCTVDHLGKYKVSNTSLDTRVTCGFMTRYKFLLHVHLQEQICNKGTNPCQSTMAT